MTTKSSVLSWDGRNWIRTVVVIPGLRDLLSSGAFRRPGRFDTDELAIDAFADLLDAQMLLIEEGKRQTMDALARATGSSGPQVQQLLAAVADWDELVYGLRFRASDRGTIGLDDSIFVVKSESWLAKGPGVFAACSPAFPPEVIEVLERYGVDTGSRRTHDDAYDAAAYLTECNPAFGAVVLSGAPLPEGTQWDYADEAHYPSSQLGSRGRREVREALEATTGHDYKIDTGEILTEEIFEPLRSAISAHECAPGEPIPIESGSISFGQEGGRHRFLGGELDVIHALRKAGFAPFFELPPNLSPNYPGAAPLKCTFKLKDGRVMPGAVAMWAAQSAFGGCGPPPSFSGVFEPVASATVAMAGGNPDRVEYARTNARVGKRDAPKRFRAGLLVRNDAATLRAWGLPGKEFGESDADVVLRASIAQAEQNVVRMSAEGTVQRAVERMQTAGMQRTGVKICTHRYQRERFLSAGEMARARAIRGI